jgi:ZIP family zinc transporter
MEQQSDAAKIGTAFALVTLAGLCAPAGACVVLFLRKSHTHLLAASIALAAGVMLFVSLTEVTL